MVAIAAAVDMIAVTVIIMAAPAIAAAIPVAKIFYNLSAVPLGLPAAGLPAAFLCLGNR
jgi:hypothetical protein